MLAPVLKLRKALDISVR